MICASPVLLGGRGVREVDVAWAAGIVDGEGHIGVYKSKIHRSHQTVKYGLRLKVAMTHLETLTKLHAVLGVGSLHPGVVRKSTYRKVWVLDLCSRQAEMAIRLLLPYLVTKREEAKVGLEFQTTFTRTGGRKLTTETVSMRDDFYWKLRELKKAS